MSVLIENMDMPRNCGECPCLLKIPSLYLCKCMLTATSIKYGEEDLRDILCPLSPLKKVKESKGWDGDYYLEDC